MGIREDSETAKNRMRFRIAIPAVLGTALLLSACGISSSRGPTTTAPSAQTAYLCQVIPRVDRLIVTRHAPGNQFIFNFPAVVNVTSASSAQSVAKAACALPDASNTRLCPAEFAVSYHLVFAVRGEKGMGGEAIDANPTGCQWVTGLGMVREALSPVAFYRLLGNAMGLKNASDQTFRGVFRTG